MRKQAWFSVGMRCFSVICVVSYGIQVVVFEDENRDTLSCQCDCGGIPIAWIKELCVSAD